MNSNFISKVEICAARSYAFHSFQGTTSGFGRRLVTSVLVRGDYVIATARSLEKLQALHPSRDSKNLHLIQLDITAGFDAIKAVVDDAVSRWGKIDALVNNAGTGGSRSIWRADTAGIGTYAASKAAIHGKHSSSLL
ncbi:hypothetical protein DFS33DRAFT_1376172 [Desarmillaria ectypa]|nr:hypothetical protein DFS33DRAFT_1376172 [Desarmillaria ectypa]